MILRIFGSRGSVPSPGADTLRYGGDTSCIHVELSDGTQLILDAGTGIRHIPDDLTGKDARIHILLTHLHLDHIQGLLFFSPLFSPSSEITIWGPDAPGPSLRTRLARYLSAPISPVDIRELPSALDFRNCPVSEWEIGPARIRAEAVTHRGPTLGFRIEDGDTTLCYLPDHEPALLGPLRALEEQWISGHALAREADLLVHDCQYTDEEYPAHFGWGHSATSHAVDFADRVAAERVLLFHHDPAHSDDDLDAAFAQAHARWQSLGHAEGSLAMACDGDQLAVAARAGTNGRLASSARR